MFTLEEVLTIIGDKVDIQGKYEADPEDGVWFCQDENDSEEMFSARLEIYANHISDLTKNSMIEHQRDKLFNLKKTKEGFKCQ